MSMKLLFKVLHRISCELLLCPWPQVAPKEVISHFALWFYLSVDINIGLNLHNLILINSQHKMLNMWYGIIYMLKLTFSAFSKYCISDHQLCQGEGQWGEVLQRNTLLFCIMKILWSQIIIWLRVHHAAPNVSLQMVFFFWEMCHPLLWCILALMAKCQCQISQCLHMIWNFMM